MGVLSFVSTVPSVIPLLQSTRATAIVPIHHSRTISCKVEADPENEYSSSRRHILHCFAATVGMVIESYLERAAMSGFSKGLQSYNLHRFHKNDGWSLFERQFGRSDAQEPDPEGRVPQWDISSVQEMKAKFSSIGFGPRQLAVMSAFLGPDQSATEALLASDPEVLPWVQKYQRSRETVSQSDYEVNLITTLNKIVFLRSRNQL